MGVIKRENKGMKDKAAAKLIQMELIYRAIMNRLEALPADELENLLEMAEMMGYQLEIEVDSVNLPADSRGKGRKLQ